MAVTIRREVVPIDRPTPHPRNPRRHGDVQINHLMRSIKMFGQIKPVVVDEKYIVLAGHGVLQALRRLGRQEVEVNVVSGLKPKQKLKLLLADNQTADLGINDFNAVESLLAEIQDYDIPGYDEELLKRLLESVSDEAEFGARDLSARGASAKRTVRCPSCGHDFVI